MYCLQGVVVGFLSAFAYNLWIVVGKFYRGGGSPKRLPLSLEGCPENFLGLVNSSITNTTSDLDSIIGQTETLPYDLYSNQTTTYGLDNGYVLIFSQNFTFFFNIDNK